MSHAAGPYAVKTKCLCNYCLKLRLPECTVLDCQPCYDFIHVSRRCPCWHTKWDADKVDRDMDRHYRRRGTKA